MFLILLLNIFELTMGQTVTLLPNPWAIPRAIAWYLQLEGKTLSEASRTAFCSAIYTQTFDAAFNFSDFTI